MTVVQPRRQREGTLGRLRRLQDHEGALLSVFITVPPDPAALREVPGRLDALLATARLPAVNGDARRRARLALAAVRRTGGVRAREWFGRTMALVASAEGGVLEELRLPCAVPERAVFGRRAMVRPVLRSLQQCRPYSAAVLDGQHAWLFEIGGGQILRVRRLEDARARGHLAELAPPGWPLVVGGHEEAVAEFLAALPSPLRERVAGTFAVDPRTMSPEGVRMRAVEIMSGHEAALHRRLAAELADQEVVGRAVRGVEPAAEAVGGSLAELLVVWGDEPQPGWVCDGCGAMSSLVATCRACRSPMRPVTDLVDAMVGRMLDMERRVELCGDEHVGPGVAAGLRRRLEVARS